MISVDVLLQRVPRLDAPTLEQWIAQEWVRPVLRQGRPQFHEVDVARVNLIVELREQMEVGDAAIPVVLSLLDQLHDARARMRLVCTVLQEAPDAPVRHVIERLLGTR